MAKVKPTVIVVRNERIITNLGLQNNVIIVNANTGQIIIPTINVLNQQPSRHTILPDAANLQAVYADTAKDLNDQSIDFKKGKIAFVAENSTYYVGIDFNNEVRSAWVDKDGNVTTEIPAGGGGAQPLLETTITIENIQGSGVYGYDDGTVAGGGGAIANDTFQLDGFGDVVVKGIAAAPLGSNAEGIFTTDKEVFNGGADGQLTARIEVNGVEYTVVITGGSPSNNAVVESPFYADMAALDGQTVSFKILEII